MSFWLQLFSNQQATIGEIHWGARMAQGLARPRSIAARVVFEDCDAEPDTLDSYRMRSDVTLSPIPATRVYCGWSHGQISSTRTRLANCFPELDYPAISALQAYSSAYSNCKPAAPVRKPRSWSMLRCRAGKPLTKAWLISAGPIYFWSNYA
jgi:hypothetical protein